MNQFTLTTAPGASTAAGTPLAYVTPVNSAASSVTGQPAVQQVFVQAGPVASNGQLQQLQPTFVAAPVAAAAPSSQPQAVPAPATSSDNGSNSSPHHPIAEFLYQLTKMLTDDNSEIIEWVNGRIKVHHPERLEGEVLHKYFRHSKFASFQRQLNYFGFRKIAGKGKMSPCAYVNEAATSDIRSLLTIKRKTNGSAARKAALAQQRSLGAAGLLPPGSQVVQISGMPGLVAPQTAITTELLQKALGATLNQQALANVGIFPQMIIQNPATVIQQAAQQQLTAATIAAAPTTIGGAAPAAPVDAATVAATAAAARPLGDSLLLSSDSTLAALARQQQSGKQSESNLSVLSTGSKTGSNNQLDLINQQVLRNSALNLAALGLGPPAATAALSALPSVAAVAAPTGGAMPASAALTGAASAAVNQAQNLFESSNLSALVGKDDKKDEKDDKGPAPAPTGRHSSSNLLGGRMPSANSIFPDTLSSVSLTGLGMPGALSSNRLNSIVSLGSLLSRDLSTADMGLTAPASKKPTTAASLGVQLNPLTTLSNIAHSVVPAPTGPPAGAPGPASGPAPPPGPASAAANPAALLAALSAGGAAGNASALLAAMAPSAHGQVSLGPGAGPASALLAAAALAPGPVTAGPPTSAPLSSAPAVHSSAPGSQ